MLTNMGESQLTHIHLLLSSVNSAAADEFSVLLNHIVTGHFRKILQSPVFDKCIVKNGKLEDVVKGLDFGNVNLDLDSIIEVIKDNLLEELEGNQQAVSNYMLLFAITLLQGFIQLNFTGPSIELQIGSFNELRKFNNSFTASLSSMGQTAYRLAGSPYMLAFSIRILEILNDSPISFLSLNTQVDNAEQLISNSNINSSLGKDDIFLASVQWWRSRAYQVQTSLLPEPSSILTSVSALLLNQSVFTTLVNNLPENIAKTAALTYQLETARDGINTNTEHLSVTALAKSKKISGLSLILTGCKAKRTKFQQTAHSSLVILAVNLTQLNDNDTKEDGPESFELNSDILLEKPHYESVGEDVTEILEENETKRIKLDYSNSSIGEDEDQDLKLLPIAFREQAIPEELKALDPNDQPRLPDLDMVQLLLRYVCIRQTSPSNSPMVEEELMALIQRILYSPEGSVNWSIYSRSLWERSLLETNKAKTVERGVLQMQSLVEELGMSSLKNKLFAETADQKNDDNNEGPLASAKRLRFIHQLPLMPAWAMDASLAEKYMSLGALKSAIDIYERLHMWNEAAICNGAVGNEKEALEFLERSLSENPNDGRALSIMGDINQDPSYWIKSWEVSKYPKAKNSLARYYYNPPKSSGLTRDLATAIDHQYDSLMVNPLSFESWYFYGCLGLEAGNFELASEAFTRCVSIDDDNSHAWSNLSSALVSLGKLKPAFSALQKAVRVGQDKVSWRIWENYLIVAAKLKQWDDVLFASRQLLELTKETNGENAVNLPIVEKLVELLLSTEYNEDNLTHFQKSCIQYVCVMIPQVINSSARAWRVVSKVELWRKKPWSALDCFEKLYRALLNNPDLDVDESVWNEAVEACDDLVAAYESYGELPGKYGADDVVCKDWKYKAKSSVRSLMSRGRSSWETTESYERLQNLKQELMN